ncbi:protein regulator of cytokinesis 1 isoform X3 [Microplitis demolitor]|uniref:protein regulator of cytokinesis 1 isoform X3 n=1 Tax=Microplitis demolitor TaxID=69319 RepID=UPI0004CD6AAA|nr:protein regulator of cytokinesis 1 isoform X3 [Microplitis demolitor]
MSDTNGKELVEKVCRKVQVKIPVLFEIWNQCGYDERMISEYSKNVDHHIEDLLVDMVEEAEQKKSAIVQEVKIISKKIKAMEVELDMDVSVVDGHQVEPLIELVGTLKKKYKALEEIKNKRIAQCKKLLAKEAKICDALGMQPRGFHKSVPSEDEMAAFEDNLAKQEAELNANKATFKEMRLSIMAMMNEMAHVPSLEFERIVCHDYENFIFSTSNMKKLRDLHSDIEEQLQAAKEDAKKKRQELIKLWKFLEIPEEKCQEFLAIHSGYDIPTLNALQKEIRKVQELRLENISKFIEKLRVDIQHWWDVCKLSKEERDDFTFFNSKIFTEDMLRIHEIEIERLRQHYEENKKIYDLLEKWEETWGQMKEIQRRSEDPDRFHNRGGQLLADEKIRKACNKNLPKLVTQLNELVAEYEKKYRKPFKISGLTISEYIEQEHEKLKSELEKLKVETVARKLIPSADTASKSLRKTPNKLGNKTINIEDSTNSSKTLQQYQEFQEHLAGRDELRSTLLSETIESRRLRRKPGTPVKPSRKHSPNTPRATPSLRDPSSPKLTSTPRLTPAPSINNIENNF